ncbi:glycine zipper 2TM domain-containing protein [Oxalobacteraceae bacterium CAVE-383]|nr:glycine zipper 2TM domain-containing protein [Oxalobacteraceae bacterium CAVE-383]
METVTKNRIHPLIASAAVAIILVCMVGVAAITGLLPGSRSANTPPRTAESSQLSSADKAAAERDAEKSAPPASPPLLAAAATPAKPEICENCGEVEGIRAIKHPKKTSGIGMVGGAVVGGLLGNQIGSGNGRILGTVAGAAGGGYAGNEIEKHTQTTTTYEVVVRMENGRVREFPQSSSNWRVGDRVRVVNGALRSRG